MNKKRLFLFFAIILLIINLNFISSQGSCHNLIDGFQKMTPEQISLLQGIQVSEVNNSMNIYFISEGIDFELLDFLSDYKEIMPRSLSKHDTFIRINKTSEEIYEADFTVKNGSKYLLGGYKNIYVPANSRLKYYNNLIDIEASDNSIFENLPEFLNSDFFSDLKINGENITISQDLALLNGVLSFNEKGYLLEAGAVNYKQNLIEVTDKTGDILISNQDLGDYKDKNWIFQDENNLKIHSSSSGNVYLQALPNHEILNTDSLDSLSFNIMNGDEIDIQNRKNQGLVPLVNVKNSGEGISIINNDGLESSFWENDYAVDIGKMPSTKSDFEKPYQSVAMEINPNSDKNEKVVINAYRQFNILSNDNQELVSFNKYHLPVSTKIEDNSLQTIGQLREKYPEIYFNVFDSEYNAFNETNMPPYLFYLTDEFFKENPNALETFDKIQFTSGGGATSANYLYDIHGTSDYMLIEDLSQLESSYKIREISGPLSTLNHEYEHHLDQIIMGKELEEIEKLNDPDMKILYQSYKELNMKFNQVTNDLKEIEKGSEESKKLNGLLKDLKKEKGLVLSDLYSTYYEKYNEKTLMQCYNEIGLKAKENLFENEKKNHLYRDFALQIQDDLLKKYDPLLKENPQIKISNYNNDPYFLDVLFSDLKSAELEKGNENIVSELEAYESSLRNLNILANENSINNKNNFFNTVSNLEDSYLSLNGYENEIRILFKTQTGVSYPYSLRDYNKEEGIPEGIATSRFAEISSTIREQEESQIVQNINSPFETFDSPSIQIAFDAGKMDIEKYKRLMGEDYCEKPDCCDKKCLTYKFLCEGSCN